MRIGWKRGLVLLSSLVVGFAGPPERSYSVTVWESIDQFHRRHGLSPIASQRSPFRHTPAGRFHVRLLPELPSRFFRGR